MIFCDTRLSLGWVYNFDMPSKAVAITCWQQGYAGATGCTDPCASPTSYLRRAPLLRSSAASLFTFACQPLSREGVHDTPAMTRRFVASSSNRI